MATQEFKIWAQTIVTDSTGMPQRRDLSLEESLTGWLRLEDVSAQKLNQLFNLASVHSNPFAVTPVQISTLVPIPSTALELNGQTITEAEAPNVFATYGATLPDLVSEAITGHTYVVRKS